MTGSFKAALQGELSPKSWPELQAWTEGDNQGVRHVTHPLGRLVLTGHSGASDNALDDALNKALQHNDLRPLTQLPGSYSAILATEGRLIAFTDPVGQNPVYYSSRGGQTIFGSRPSLAAPNEHLTPDLSGLAMGLVLPGAYARIFPESSSFKEIGKLPGGGMACATAEGVRITTYETLTPCHDSLTEAAERLRSALTAAIHSRLELGLLVAI